MEPLRLSNALFAVPRLMGLIGVVLVTAGFIWVTVHFDSDRTSVVTAFGVLAGMLAWSLYAVVTAVWWLEVRDEGIRYRTCFGVRTCLWSQVREVRPLYLRAGLIGLVIPAFRHEAIEFAVGRWRRITLCPRKRDRLAAAERLGPRWTEKTFAGETDRDRRAVVAGVAFVLLVILWVILAYLMKR